MLPGVALGAEQPEPGIMRQPPRSPDERLIDGPLLARVYLFLGPLEAFGSLFAFFWILRSGGWIYGQPLDSQSVLYRQATTACLIAIIIMQTANVFLCRSEIRPALAFGLKSNRLILTGILLGIVLLLLITYTGLGNRLFGTAPVTLEVWLLCLPMALALLCLEEFRKVVAKTIRALSPRQS
jgi:magnesium-transporting ATPase (P-type)